jgi:Domain of unknown function (DUF4926)
MKDKCMKPEEYDVVRLLRPLPDYNAPVGAEGTVVMVLTANDLPRAYAVEFPESVGTNEPWFTIAEADLEVVWRQGVGWLPGFEPDSSQ